MMHRTGTVLVAGFAFAGEAAAQEAASLVDSSLFGSAQEGATTGWAVEPLVDDGGVWSGEATEEVEEESREQLKKLIPQAFLIRLAAGALYDDNLFLAEKERVHDMVLQGQLGVTIQPTQAGKATFAFDYQAVGFMYLDHRDLDAINHTFGMTAGLMLPKTQLGFSANYQRVAAGEQAGLQLVSASPSKPAENATISDTSGTANQQSQNADREAGSFSVRDVIAGSFSASRLLAPKTNFTSSLGYSGTLYQDNTFQDSQDYSARVGLNYEFSGKTTFGFAGTFGKLDNGLNSSQTYQNILLTASYNASGKLVFRGEAGVEFRQYGTREPLEVVTVTAPVPVPVVTPVVEPVVEVVAPPPVVTLPVTGPPASPLEAADPGVATSDPPVVPAPVPQAPAAETAPVETVVAVPLTDPAPVVDYATTELPEEEDSTRFVFNLQAAYQVRVRTTLRLSASRGTGGSATLGSPSVQRTTLSIGLDQGIGRRFALGLEGGYQLEDYGSTTRVPDLLTGEERAGDPNQVYLFGRATLNYMPRPNTSIGLFYEFRSNDGGDTGQTYEANRLGVQAAISF